MNQIKTPAGKYLSNVEDILEVVGPFEFETNVYQPVSKFGLTIRYEDHQLTFGYDTEKSALNDAIFIDSL